jgi:hypothetical protein
MNKRIAKAIPGLSTPDELAAQHALIDQLNRESQWALNADRVDELLWALKLIGRSGPALGLSDISINVNVQTHRPSCPQSGETLFSASKKLVVKVSRQVDEHNVLARLRKLNDSAELRRLRQMSDDIPKGK